VKQETRHWDEDAGQTRPGRSKEEPDDYRYFPEPDLVPVVVDAAWVERVRSSIGELPAARRSRFETDYGLPPYDANVLVEQGEDVADYFDAVARGTGEYKLASNWIQQDVLRTAKEKKITLAEFPVKAEALADLIDRVHRRELNTNQGREVLARMIETGEPADAIIKAGGFGMVSDRDALVAAVEAALAANPKAVEDLKGGKKKPEAVKGFLRGQVMKQTGGKADPSLVSELLDAKLAEMAQ
jgi:aspartyl-tRNA(Asn)/glutamyl-tRNA(Gln) amidotransferase subunit B